MNVSKKLEKSRGVVLFAFNTNINYISIAENCARLIDKHLKLPITLITDTPDLVNYQFDNIIQTDNNIFNYKSSFNKEIWRNTNRYQIYDLSPYEETLLLDSDYLVFNDDLLQLFEIDGDYKMIKNNQTLDENWNFTMGPLSLPYMWATVIFFRKTIKSKQFFNLVGRIQRNYSYYSKLYNIRERNFRNDYAFTIADYILNGYFFNSNSTISGTMLTFDKNIKSMQFYNQSIIIREETKAHIIPIQNIHIMDKQYLLTDNFKQFVDSL